MGRNPYLCGHETIPLSMKQILILLLIGLLPFKYSMARSAANDFTACALPDSVFALMQGRSYKVGCGVPRATLRYLRVKHYDAGGREHVGELVCHKDLAADLLAIFRELHRARYPIERMRLIDYYGADDERSMAANNTSAFNYRRVAGSKALSKHSIGRAIDINPLYNPCVSRDGRKVQPAKGRRYANRSLKSPYRITRGDLCHRLFKQHGFVWGGDWRSLKDYQHFEKP